MLAAGSTRVGPPSHPFRAVKLQSPSPALLRLLDRKLDTLEKLELVLMLRDAPGPLTLQHVAVELQVGHEVLRRLVDEVARTGLIEWMADDELRLQAEPDELETIDEAARILGEDRTRMSTLFSTLAIERIRTMAARTFAEAFKIRKKPDDDG